MTILSLDFGARTGYARLGDNGVPIINHRDFAGQRMLADLRSWLVGLVVAHRIETIAIEALFVGKNAGTAISAAHMHGVAREVIQAHNLRFIDMTPDNWRSHFLGRAKAPKTVLGSARRRAWLKKAARAECERRGWQVANDDQADAAGILDFARCLLDRRYGVASTPLFDQAGGAF